jgi:hypothetical protein
MDDLYSVVGCQRAGGNRMRLLKRVSARFSVRKRRFFVRLTVPEPQNSGTGRFTFTLEG